MKRLLSLLLAAMLCVCLALPAPAARAEQNSITIYSMLLFLIQGFGVQPTAAYDVTDMLTDSEVLNTDETVIGFLMHQNWLLLSGLNSQDEYAATVFVYEDDTFFVLLEAIAGAYESLQQMTSRPQEKLIIEITFQEGATYVFDSAGDAAALLELFSE